MDSSSHHLTVKTILIMYSRSQSRYIIHDATQTSQQLNDCSICESHMEYTIVHHLYSVGVILYMDPR